MLSREGCQRRCERLWQKMPDVVEWLLIADPRHVKYLCNFWVEPFSFSFGERCWLLLDRENGSTLLGDNYALRSAAGKPFVDRIAEYPWYDHKRTVINRDHALLRSLIGLVDGLKDRVGLAEEESLSSFAMLLLDEATGICRADLGDCFKSRSGTSLGSILRELRRRKDPDEIALLKQCMQATAAGHAKAREIIRPGLTEYEVYCAVQSAALEATGRPAIVYGDFRANNGKTPKTGGLPAGGTLQEGDLFILDYSVMLDGYRSDFTNTLAVGGPTAAQRKLFRLCQECMQAGEAALKAGVAASDVYEAASAPMKAAGHEGGLPHHAGHGLGLAHPEPPILTPRSTDTLLAGDVITLEPGLYLEGLGGVRIERNYLITETGSECLSHHEIALT